MVRMLAARLKNGQFTDETLDEIFVALVSEHVREEERLSMMREIYTFALAVLAMEATCGVSAVIVRLS